MSSQIVSSSLNMTIYGENAGTNSSESDESDWNYEQNCSDGEFDNNEIRDDMDFETHVDPLLEIGGSNKALQPVNNKKAFPPLSNYKAFQQLKKARVALCTCFLKSNVLGGFAFIGEGIPVATGAAFSSKYRREVYKEDCDHVTLAFFGDGTCNNGQFYECLNMAALWKLPIVFVVENNLWAIGMSNLRATSDPEIWKKGAFGMPDVHVDGMDVLRATTLASLSLVDYFEFIQTSP
nr:collinsiaXII-like protein [Ipomoea batatas]